MSELRQNMATKEWVIISSERAKRPQAYIESEMRRFTHNHDSHDPQCPFCILNEELDLETERWPTVGPWQIRAVHNKFPALIKDETLTRTMDGVQRRISGVGHHEIVVEHPRHNTTLGLMSGREIEAVLEMFYSRGWDIRNDGRVKQIIYFKNHGRQAGASLQHPHSQIIGLPVVPAHIRQRTDEVRRYFDDTGECVFCIMMEAERTQKERVIEISEHYVAFALYAAPTPFYMWIVPRRHSVSFLYTTFEERSDLARILQTVLQKLYIGLKDPAYNLVIRSAPVKEMGNDYLHWHLEVIPRLSQTAGFELGSGMFINPTFPEHCAEFLRGIDVTQNIGWLKEEVATY